MILLFPFSTPLDIMRAYKFLALSFLFSALLSTIASADLVVTYAEGPSEVNSKLSGTTVFNFNDLAPGLHSDVKWSDIATFDELYILAPDAYGGAVDPGYENGSPYAVQADFAGVTETSLTFTEPHAYFGFWWSAGDSQNHLEFYSNNRLVAHFTSSTLLDELAVTSDYRGNPRDRGLNYGENYAFINFFGQNGTTWDKIVLSNSPGSGFESDNYTDRVTPWSLEADGPMPGRALATLSDSSTTAPIPEAGSSVLGLIGASLLLVRRKARTTR